MSIETLKKRLFDTEDNLNERKSSGASSEVIRTVVGFANSVPENRTGVLFVGVNDKGDVIGVENPDKLQKTIRNMCEKECYPAIWVNIVALNCGDKTVIAVEIPYSNRKPYFAGPAFIRRGSETINASEDLFQQLILQRLDKCRYILNYKDAIWTVEAIGKLLGASYDLSGREYRASAECRIEEVTAHFIRFKNISTDTFFTEELNFINPSWDEDKNRPKIVVRYKI